jgi:hypothetical protein
MVQWASPSCSGQWFINRAKHQNHLGSLKKKKSIAMGHQRAVRFYGREALDSILF